VKLGDMVTDDRSHMDKSNWFYNAWLKHGVIVEDNDDDPDVVTVVWWRHGKMWRQSLSVSKLELVSEGR
jgi:hypothetical protein